MIDPQIFAITLLLLTILYLALSVRVILMRQKYQIPYATTLDKKGLGESEKYTFMASISAQRNFNDYTPFALIILFLWLHFHPNAIFYGLMCAMLVIARCAHAFGILYMEQQKSHSLLGRKIGVGLTFLTIVISAISALIYSFMTP